MQQHAPFVLMEVSDPRPTMPLLPPSPLLIFTAWQKAALPNPEVAPDGGHGGTLWGFLGVPNHVHFLLLVMNEHRFGKLTPLTFMPPVPWAEDPGSIGCH